MTKALDAAAIPLRVWSSCVREAAEVQRLRRSLKHVLREARAPRQGDLVLARTRTVTGAYTKIENRAGRLVPLRKHDYVVGVLAPRHSGTNIYAEVPRRVLHSGDKIELVAASGLLGDALSVPHYLAGRTLTLDIVGFLSIDGQIGVNLLDLTRCADAAEPAGGEPVRNLSLVVAGTAAEVGKTTTACALVRALHERKPEVRVGVVKASGTGRLRDPLAYRAAGADAVADFVDLGWPTTYDQSPTAARSMFRRLLRRVAHTDVVITEFGGDLLEGGVREGLHLAAAANAIVIFCVNDALGALAGRRILVRAGLRRIVFASLCQNVRALAARLGNAPVIDPRETASVHEMLDQLAL